MALLVLQEFDDPGRAVREMARTTRRGGTVAACLWDFQDMPMFSLFWRAAEAVAPAAVARRRAERPPSRPGLQALGELWTGAGLTEVRTAGLELSQEFGSFEDFWLPLLAESTPMSEFATAVNRETHGELAIALRRIIPSVRPDGSFALPAACPDDRRSRTFLVYGPADRSGRPFRRGDDRRRGSAPPGRAVRRPLIDRNSVSSTTSGTCRKRATSCAGSSQIHCHVATMCKF